MVQLMLGVVQVRYCKKCLKGLDKELDRGLGDNPIKLRRGVSCGVSRFVVKYMS